MKLNFNSGKIEFATNEEVMASECANTSKLACLLLQVVGMEAMKKGTSKEGRPYYYISGTDAKEAAEKLLQLTKEP